MTCLADSAGGEMVCASPPPDDPVGQFLVNTGLEVALWAWVILALVALGLFVMWLSRKVRQ